MKTCTKCGECKPLDEFYVLPVGHSGRINPGTFPECKPCNRDRARAWQRDKRERDPEYAIRTRLWSLYRLTLEKYADILAAQGGRCAICGTGDPGGQGGFHVDHDHACCPDKKSCGECVRGLLCHGCNTGLGNFAEDLDRLTAAAAYLLSRQNVLGAVTF